MSRRSFERGEQPVVVARVQADRRLVEDVEHADQAAADLPGQADALRLAAGERRGGAVEREVVQADVEQEAEPAADFLQHLRGDQRLVAFERELGEELGRVGDRERAHFAAASARAASRELLAERRDLAPQRACGLSRWPSQAGQRMMRMYFSSCLSCIGLLLVRYFASSSGMMPSNVPPYFCDDLPARQVYVMCSSPVPQSKMWRCSSARSFHGVSSSVPFGELELAFHRLGDAAIDVPLPAAQVLPRADRARSRLAMNDLSGAVTSRSGSKLKNSPRPSHSRHMPCGLLKLKSCGVGGSKLMPQSVQA